MKCPDCQAAVLGKRGQSIHDAKAHPEKATFRCLLCGHPSMTKDGLLQHGYGKHKGKGKGAWFGRIVQVEASANIVTASVDPSTATTVTPAPVAFADSEVVDVGGLVAKRRIAPAEGDRNNAASLTNLPWLKFPATVRECDETLNAISVAIEKADRSLKFWLSLRAYITALRGRLESVAA